MFCTAGFHAVTVDAILEKAGVARMTLYKNFGSKEDLIVATLRREDKLFRQWLTGSIEAFSAEPADRILSLFLPSSTVCLRRVLWVRVHPRQYRVSRSSTSCAPGGART